MKRLTCLIIIASLTILECCAPSGETALPTGDISEVTLRTGNSFKGEFLCLMDSSLIFLSDNKVRAVTSQSVSKIAFEKYSDASWVGGVLLYEVLPCAVLFAVASSVKGSEGQGVILVAGLIPAIMNTVLFVTSTPESSFDELNSVGELKELRKFARYPGGLTQSQLKDVLKFYGQESLIYDK